MRQLLLIPFPSVFVVALYRVEWFSSGQLLPGAGRRINDGQSSHHSDHRPTVCMLSPRTYIRTKHVYTIHMLYNMHAYASHVYKQHVLYIIYVSLPIETYWIIDNVYIQLLWLSCYAYVRTLVFTIQCMQCTYAYTCWKLRVCVSSVCHQHNVLYFYTGIILHMDGLFAHDEFTYHRFVWRGMPSSNPKTALYKFLGTYIIWNSLQASS